MAGTYDAYDSTGGEMTTGKKIALARAISDFGDMFRIVAFPLIVIGIRDNPMDLALAETFGTTGMFLGSLVTPFFIDRFSKNKINVSSGFFITYW